MTIPPPEPLLEEIGSKNQSGQVWIDGQYLLDDANRWVWEPGAWCTPPLGAEYYARNDLRRYRKEARPIIRWNDIDSRMEEVQTGIEMWSWAPGAWYKKNESGSYERMKERGACTQPDRLTE